MTEISCSYSGDREQSLIAYLYDDIESAERARFSAHLNGCERCRRDLAALGGVRQRLAAWSPPEPASISQVPSAASPAPSAANQAPSAASRGPSSPTHGPWWRTVPVWAEVAAALLLLGVSAAIANLDIRYDAQGVSVRTGWSRRAIAVPASTEASGDAVSRAELTALAQQLRMEMRAAQPAPQPSRTAAADADVIRRVRGLIDESEKREQRELALRVAQVLQDVSAQRQVDLSNIDRNLGVIQNKTGVEILRQREMVNYLMRVSQRQ
jgi:hypothetical protein